MRSFTSTAVESMMTSPQPRPIFNARIIILSINYTLADSRLPTSSLMNSAIDRLYSYTFTALPRDRFSLRETWCSQRLIPSYLLRWLDLWHSDYEEPGHWCALQRMAKDMVDSSPKRKIENDFVILSDETLSGQTEVSRMLW
jgi:hypothetical protein